MHDMSITEFYSKYNIGCFCSRDQNCLADERCLGGLCRTICNSDSKCGPKQICEDRLCDVGCRSDSVCPDNESCINKQCRSEYSTINGAVLQWKFLEEVVMSGSFDMFQSVW